MDGAPRVSCVTPARRVAGREITTLDGLPDGTAARWAEALVAAGGSQCGFCTPGIIMRLAALGAVPGDPPAPIPSVDTVDRSLLAHLCRCTGWQTIEEAAACVLGELPAVRADRDLDAAGRRATLEGGSPQRVGPDVALGHGGFADDGAPLDALVAVPDGDGGYAVAGTLRDARARAGKVQGRRTTVPPAHPVEVAPGDWALTLATAWVEPAYVEPDASWCAPGGSPTSPCANGGAFGGKRHSPVAAAARRLADEHGRPVRVLWSREDVVRLGPKRPPVSVGMAADGTGVLRVGVSGPAWDADQLAACRSLVAAVAPGLVVEPVPVVGPPVSTDLRAAVWAEAAVVEAARRAGGVVGVPRVGVPVAVVSPSGGRAEATFRADGSLSLELSGGEVLDEVVLRSYGIGAAHQAVGWVTAEGLAVDGDGVVGDLTVRSFGVLPARAMPAVEVTVVAAPGAVPVNASDGIWSYEGGAAGEGDARGGGDGGRRPRCRPGERVRRRLRGGGRRPVAGRRPAAGLADRQRGPAPGVGGPGLGRLRAARRPAPEARSRP